MSHLHRALALTIVVFATAVACASAAAAAGGDRASVLVLRNGRVMRGHVTPAGDHFLVTLAERSQVRVPASQVEFHCADIDEAYLRRRAMLPPNSVEAHLDLADWCLREDLLPGAFEQFRSAAALDADHPRVKHLEVRLQFARQPRPAPDITPRFNAVPADEVSDAIRSLPNDAIAQYATTIQPLLLNRCGAATCHGPTTGTSFRLLRPSWAKSLPQRLTHRNLHAALPLVDHDRPDASPLIRICLEPHGGAAKPIFDDSEHYQWQQIEAWIRQLARKAPSPPPLAFSPPNTILSRPEARSESHLPDYREPADPRDESESTHPERMSFPGTSPAAAREPSTAGGVFRPRDPFDPEIFNRRFFPTDP